MAETVSEATRERITDAAVRAVRAAPVSTLTVQAVADAAGVTSSSIYKAYRNKYELFAEASRRVLVDQVIEVARSVDESAPPLERLRQVLVTLLRVCSDEPFAAAYLYGMFPLLHHGDVDPSVQAMIDHVDEQLRSRLRHRVVDALESGALHGDADQITELCRVAAMGFVADAVHGPVPLTPEAAAAFVVAGLGA